MNEPRFELIRKIDHLDGNWYLWECLRENPDRSRTVGTIQADGQGEWIANDTFEKDE